MAYITTRNNANERREKCFVCPIGIAKLINTHFDFHFDFDSYEM